MHKLHSVSCHRDVHNMQENNIQINKAVKNALDLQKPVVALESTIITHGMPYPQNLQTALEVEEIIFQNGATPATVGVINGKIHVGMEKNTIKELSQKSDVHKLSRRDLAIALTKCYSGGTTVSATMLIAKWCGIKVFVTGGIGGVHKQGEISMDISSDLRELGRTPIMVVSSGIKSILDIGRTLEYLETEGVTVATLGKSKTFPAFFAQSSEFLSPQNVADAKEAARLLLVHSELNMNSGVLLAVPIPHKDGNMGDIINDAVITAIKEGSSRNITGKDATPFLLQRVNELTSGLSLRANILLIKNNAEVGAKVAKCYSGLTKQAHKNSRNDCKKVPIVIGGSNIDVVSKSINKVLLDGVSNPAVVSQTLGGVGRNMAEVLWRLNFDPFLISAVGCDIHGRTILDEMKYQDMSGVVCVENCRTSMYNVVFDVNGEVCVAVMDSDIHDKISSELILKHQDQIIHSSLVCVDANIPTETMKCVCSLCSRYDIPLLYEPTGILLAAKGYQAKSPFDFAITYMTPSLSELAAIYESVTGQQSKLTFDIESLSQCDNHLLRQLIVMCNALLPYTPCILVTLGNLGVFAAYSVEGNYCHTYYPVTPLPNRPWLKEPVGNVSGSGDSFAAGFACGVLQYCNDIDKAVQIGITVAQRTLRSHRSVSSNITEKDAKINLSDWTSKVVT